MMLLDTSHHVPLANLHEFTGDAGKNSIKKRYGLRVQIVDAVRAAYVSP